MAKPIENILIFPLESKMDRTRHRVTSNSYIRFRDSYVEYETRAIFINFSLKNFSKLQNSYLAIVFRYRQTSSNVVKHRQTSSNIVKRRQTSSNIVKYHQTSSNITLARSFFEKKRLFVVKHPETSSNVTLARSFFEKKRCFVKHRETSSNITLTRFFLRRRDALSSNIVKHRQT